MSKRPFCVVVTCSLAQNTPRACNYVTKLTKQPKSNASTQQVQEETTEQQIASQCNQTQHNLQAILNPLTVRVILGCYV